MKTIEEYKEEFLKLANEMEKDLGCTISDIYMERYDGDVSKPINSFRIEFKHKE